MVLRGMNRYAWGTPPMRHVIRLIVIAVTLSLASATQAMQTDNSDNAAVAVLFSYFEAVQLHFTANALAMAAINKAPSEEIAQHCDRSINTFEEMSVPLFRRYADKCSTDPEMAAVTAGIVELQQASLDEVRAVKEMAESGNAAKQQSAFLESAARYSETATRVGSLIFPQAGTGTSVRTAATLPAKGDESPNARIFSNEAWADIVKELKRQGLVREAADAKRFFPTLSLLKSVFVEKKIQEPSPKQLFGLAKLLNVSFAQMSAEKIEVTLRAMLLVAKDLGQEVASKNDLMQLGE